MKKLLTAIAFLFVVLQTAYSADTVATTSTPKETMCIIVHKDNPLSTMSQAVARDIFLRKKLTWADALKGVKKIGDFDVKQKVQPVMLSSGEAHQAFLSKILKKDKASLERYWIKLQYQKAIKRPKQVSKSDKMLRYIGSLKGGIGVVRLSDLDKDAKTKVKIVLKIEI